MARGSWYPYAPDQDFGVRLSADQELLDRLVSELDRARRRPPRPANKAPIGRGASTRMPSAGWTALMVRGDPTVDGPITTASALEAAAEMGTFDE